MTKESETAMALLFKDEDLKSSSKMSTSCSSTTLSTQCMSDSDTDSDMESVSSIELDVVEECTVIEPMLTKSFEVGETLEMPFVAEQGLKMLSVRKTNLEAKLMAQREEERRRQRIRTIVCVLCFLIDFFYEGRLRLVGTAVSIALLTM